MTNVRPRSELEPAPGGPYSDRMTDRTLRRLAGLSILAALVTIVMKSVAYQLTGSVGLFADALESVINLVAAAAAYGSLWYAGRPADPSHAYGHEKIEYFSGGFEGGLVFAAGLGTVWYAIERLLHPAPLEQLGAGTAVAVAAGLVNLIVARILLSAAKKSGSLILEADGHHLMTDVITSAAVVAGLGLVWLTGVTVLDPLLALAVGVHILGTGFGLVRRSVNGLMDHALPHADQGRVRDLIRSALPTGADFHLLRTRQAGRRKFADFHLLVDGGMSVRAAHAVAHAVETRVRAAFPELELVIHIEPIDERTSWETAALQALGEPAEPAPVQPAPPPIDD